MRVAFNSTIIGELRNRAVAHNQIVGEGSDCVKINELKRLYVKYHQGQDPQANALAKIDDHLKRIQMAKSGGRFDEQRHPRGGRGRFRDSGRPPAPPVPPPAGDRNNDLLTAAQTQVIPETRYTQFGPPIAAAAGVGLGAISGASATYHGSIGDRIATRALRYAGGKIAQGGARSIASAPNLVSAAARAGVTTANRTLGTRIPRPSATMVPPAALDRIGRLGNQAGRFVGTHAGRALGFAYGAPAAFARNRAHSFVGGGIKGRIAGHVAGAVVGGLFPGAAIYAPSLHHAQERIGPYEDTLFPRRVKKMAGEMFDDPIVLAKIDAIMADPELAKINVGQLASRLLRLGSRATAHTESIRPLSEAEQQAQTIFDRHAAQVTVRPARRMLGPLAAAHVVPHAIAGAAAGSAVGAGGAALYSQFNQQHPRDQHGRFRRKGELTVAGAKIGAAVGLGLGLAGGLIAARRGHTGLLTAALARLRGEQPGTLDFPGTKLHGTQGNLPDVMIARARRAAQVAHAIAHRERNPRIVPPFAGVGTEVEHVLTHLKTHHENAFSNSALGQALRANNPAVWYRYQLDRAFDATLKTRGSTRNLWSLGEVTDKSGKPLPRTASNLINSVDPEKLNTAQRKIWDDVVEKHDTAMRHIGEVYAGREARVRQTGEQIAVAEASRDRLEVDLADIPVQWARLARNTNADLATIRNFTSAQMAETLPRNIRTREAAIEHVNSELMPRWTAKTQAALDGLSETLNPEVGLGVEHTAATAERNQGLRAEEIEPIKDPFGLGSSYYLRRRPEGSFAEHSDTYVGQRMAPFITTNTQAAQAAEEHLQSLMAAQEEALASRIPGASAGQKFFAWAAPHVAPHIRQAVEDFNALRGSSTSRLDKLQLGMRAWMSGNIQGMKQWATQSGLMTGSYGQRARHVGAIARRNWKTIASLVSAGSTFGVLDLNAPWIFQFDRKKWNRPRNLSIVHEFPDAVRRPNEALFGVSYRDRDNRTRLLHGVYVKNASGEHQTLPFGSDLEQVRGAIRGGQGGVGGGGATPAPVQHPRENADALTRLRQGNHIHPQGPEDFRFEQRTGGDPGTAQSDLIAAIRASSNTNYLQSRGGTLADQSTDQPNAFYDRGLFQLFDHPLAPTLNLQARAQLLIGNHLRSSDPNWQRGMFGGTSVAWPAKANADKGEIVNRLRAQLRARNLQPDTPQKYAAMRKAMWVVGEYYELSDSQMQQVKSAIDTTYQRHAHVAPPASAADIVTAPEHSEEASREATAIAAHLVSLTRADQRPPNLTSDSDLQDVLAALYDNEVRRYRREHAGARNLDDSAHHQAEAHVREWLETQTRKAEPDGAMQKISGSAAFRRPRISAASQNAPQTDVAEEQKPDVPRSSPLAPPIRRAAVRQTAPVQQPGMPQGPSLSHQVRQSLRPARAANQLGSYGGGQLGSELLGGLAEGALPGGKLVHLAAAATGGIGGTALGSRAGRSGEPSSLGEVAARGIGGAAAQYGAWRGLSRLGVKSLTQVAHGVGHLARSRIAGAASRIGLAARLATGAEEGAALGAAVTPEFAGLGAIPGALGGIAAGALAGYLTDEGIGIMYRHLKRYGSHVPAHVLGIRPNQRTAGAVA